MVANFQVLQGGQPETGSGIGITIVVGEARKELRNPRSENGINCDPMDGR